MGEGALSRSLALPGYGKRSPVLRQPTAPITREQSPALAVFIAADIRSERQYLATHLALTAHALRADPRSSKNS
jgi:hypothetical protein